MLTKPEVEFITTWKWRPYTNSWPRWRWFSWERRRVSTTLLNQLCQRIVTPTINAWLPEGEVVYIPTDVVRKYSTFDRSVGKMSGGYDMQVIVRIPDLQQLDRHHAAIQETIYREFVERVTVFRRVTPIPQYELTVEFR